MALDPLARFSLAERVVVLTGASSGLGRRFAEVLSTAGAKLVLAARREELLAEIAAEIPGSLAVVTDVAREEDLQHLIDATIERFGRIDVLVNNAGTVSVTPPIEESADSFRHVLEVNLTGPFLLTQLCARRMIEGGGGCVLNVASVLGVVGGRVPVASYAASKGAVVNLTRELAAQWARDNIRVNALAPGWFASEMTTDMFASERGRSFIERNTPMGRAGDTEELDGALLFLVSDASSFVTGQVLCVDGGWTAI